MPVLPSPATIAKEAKRASVILTITILAWTEVQHKLKVNKSLLKNRKWFEKRAGCWNK